MCNDGGERQRGLLERLPYRGAKTSNTNIGVVRDMLPTCLVTNRTDLSHASTLLEKSVRHEAADRARGEQIVGHASEDPLSHAAVPIGAGDEQVCFLIVGELNELRCAGAFLLENNLRADADPVSRQMLGHIVNVFARGRFLTRFTNLDDGDARGLP